jgi:hypothetical protein
MHRAKCDMSWPVPLLLAHPMSQSRHAVTTQTNGRFTPALGLVRHRLFVQGRLPTAGGFRRNLCAAAFCSSVPNLMEIMSPQACTFSPQR